MADHLRLSVNGHGQIHLHEEYGGVVPDLASREHFNNFLPLLEASGILKTQFRNPANRCYPRPRPFGLSGVRSHLCKEPCLGLGSARVRV